MNLDNRFVHLENTELRMLENYRTSKSKIQTILPYLREKYEKYYSPKLISFGPIHHGHPKLKRGEQYKLMWASMYAKKFSQNPRDLYQKMANNIGELRELFSWDEIGIAHDHYNNENLAWMLFVDGCSVLQILDAKKPFTEYLKVNTDIIVIVKRDLLLLENQLPYQLLKLLREDESKLKKSMRRFCELQNMFRGLESPQSQLSEQPEHNIEISNQSSPPNHLLDCLRTFILSSGINESRRKVTLLERVIRCSTPNTGILGVLTEAMVTAVFDFLALKDKKEKHTSYRSIQELKTVAIQVKRQANISLKNISFSSSFFGGKLHLPPLILDDSNVPLLLNLVAYEMCPDFINKLEITSYVKLLDLLIDHAEDVKELRLSSILYNSLGSDEEVVELFNNISSDLVHDPTLYSEVRNEMEKHYRNTLRIWVAEASYTYFKSPWTFIAFMAALTALVLTALQTWLAFKSN